MWHMSFSFKHAESSLGPLRSIEGGAQTNRPNILSILPGVQFWEGFGGIQKSEVSFTLGSSFSGETPDPLPEPLPPFGDFLKGLCRMQ